MDRRTFVSGVAALAGGALAGCPSDGEVPETAPSPPPGVREATPKAGGGPEGTVGSGGGEPPEDVVENPEGANNVVLLSQDVSGNDEGQLVVIVGVRNDGSARETALVDVTVRTESGELALERFVTLDPGEETEIRFTPGVPRDSFGGMGVEIRATTPATPIASDRV